jgi:hypothetical protein
MSGYAIPAPLVDPIRRGAHILLGDGVASLGIAAITEQRADGDAALERLVAVRALLLRLGLDGGEATRDLWLPYELRDVLAAAVEAQILAESGASRVLALTGWARACGLIGRLPALPPAILNGAEDMGTEATRAGTRAPADA